MCRFAVMACCWIANPKERPTFLQLLACLQDFHVALGRFIWTVAVAHRSFAFSAIVDRFPPCICSSILSWSWIRSPNSARYPLNLPPLTQNQKEKPHPIQKKEKIFINLALVQKKFNPTNEKSLLRQFCSCPWMAHRELDVYVFSCVVVDVTQWMTSRSDVSWRVCVHTLRCSSMLQWTWIIITSFLYFSDRQHTLPTGSFNNRKNGTKYCGSKPSNFSLEFKQSRHNLLFLILICWKKLKINWTYYSNGFCRIKGLVKAIYK